MRPRRLAPGCLPAHREALGHGLALDPPLALPAEPDAGVDAVLGAAPEGDADARLVGRMVVHAAALAAVDEEEHLDDARPQAARALPDADPHRHAATLRDAAEAGVEGQR